MMATCECDIARLSPTRTNRSIVMDLSISTVSLGRQLYEKTASIQSAIIVFPELDT